MVYVTFAWWNSICCTEFPEGLGDSKCHWIGKIAFLFSTDSSSKM